jgi:glycosyltransferase involved in cell wall biosynthesis
MRYLWELYPAYRSEWTRSPFKRSVITLTSPWLRAWDYATAARVDEFVANSHNVSLRIWHTYRRHSSVVYPPVAVDSFFCRPASDYCLCVSELVPYKRVSDAVRVFARSGRKLRIVGEGSEYKRLKRDARTNIEFCGRVTDEELRELYARCTAFIMPAEEDFGIAAVEAMASGKPVVGFARGGALETVPRSGPVGGILYSQPGEPGLAEAMEALDLILPRIDERALRAWAQRFSEEEFRRNMSAAVFAQASAHPDSWTTPARAEITRGASHP